MVRPPDRSWWGEAEEMGVRMWIKTIEYGAKRAAQTETPVSSQSGGIGAFANRCVYLREVVAAEDGPSALARLEESKKFDLLFTDVVMPGG